VDLNTFFLAVIALCAIISTMFLIIFVLSVLRTLSSSSEKLAIITFELEQILPSLRQSAKNIEGVTSFFGILNLFKSRSNK
jgi:hypothetical protein